ncbi:MULTISPECIES: DUF3849 domain-containing protein [unclassified Dehalobacter]|uniref:DUF3849 domain-containing protein n=1 Tax=unclassified Dehalobacter TaxID=2635733 RepID=UPI00028AEFA7|nr:MULTISPECIES: DUF3849 domain-containing protein [unclassified Dehalobacter]AFV01112.1 hypothetical protein DHBDCA_p84 [Dehalobacter sp. DCA]AFV04155.1 hypothetical protein DCF50_p149 [Dehalobacter sp. CF]
MRNYDTVERWRDEYYCKLQDCKKAMMDDYALSQAYNNHTFREFMEQLIGTHGLEHVSLLLSNTIREAPWDGRYSGEIKAWANRYPAIQPAPAEQKEPMRIFALSLYEHPVILNQAARIAMQKEKELAHPKHKEPER